jgi:ATP/maltotriose-dependent transcriptional regulator MalT
LPGLAGRALSAEAALVALTSSFFSGEPAAAQAQLEEARREAEAVDVPFYRAYVLIAAGQAALGAGRIAESDALLRTAEAGARRLGPAELASALMARAMTVEAGGRDTEAAHLLVEAFEISIAMGNRWWPTYLLSALAGVAVRAGDVATGARFFGASAFYAHEHAVAPDFPGTDARRRRDLSAARDLLGEVDFDAAWRAGREMPLGELLDLARVLASRADRHTLA